MTTNVNASRTSQQALDAVGKVSTGLFIDGQWCEAASGKRFDVVNPATEEVIATVADGGTEDAQRAIETAGRAQKDWAKTPPRVRSEILRRAYDIIMDRQDELALIEVSGESGAGLVKVVMTCKHDVKRVTIDPSLLGEDKDMLEDLVAAAFNAAVRKAEETTQEKMGKLTAGLPPGMKLPF